MRDPESGAAPRPAGQKRKPPDTRCGIVALLGSPNVGKSSLVNRLAGDKVSIVTPKAQTTRMRIRGLCLHGSCQLVLVDTPGLFVARRRLERAMVDAAWAASAEADERVLLIDATRHRLDDVHRIMKALAGRDKPPLLAINKIDRVARPALLGLTRALADRHDFSAVAMISALTGDGVADLRDMLVARMPPGPWLYPEDRISDLPARLAAAEITREKAFLNLHDELPYALTVETESWQEKADGSLRIGQILYVSQESQKGIALGHRGRTIKRIRTQAQAGLTDLLQRPVHLFVTVRVRRHWRDDPDRYRMWGLRYDAP